MCEVRILVIGKSKERNAAAVLEVAKRCQRIGGQSLKLSPVECHCIEICSCHIQDYDLVAVDDDVPIGTRLRLMGSDVPAVRFSCLFETPHGHIDDVVSDVIAHAVACGDIREKIEHVTEQIEMTSRMLASIAS